MPAVIGAEDLVVAVRGRFRAAEGQSRSIAAMEMSIPDIDVVGSTPVDVSLPSYRCTASTTASLQRLQANYPGRSEVRVQVTWLFTVEGVDGV